jgi:OOP family OmpA-OmpF porin
VSSLRVGAHPGRIGLVAAALAFGASRLTAQHAGQFEVGAFGSYTKYDPTFGLPTKIGGGARLGYLFGNVLGVEGDLLFQQEYNVVPASGTPQSLQPLIGSASLVVNALHAERLMVYVLGGYTVLDFGTRAPYKFTDNAAHAGAGVRLFLTNRIALRAEGRAIFTPSTHYTLISGNPRHYVGTVGLSVFHLGGGGAVKDADHDGVPDDKDACPNTPEGAVVDKRGCPIDSDGDGVPDGIDQCPNTPKGATVDAKGCPTDSDGDGVPDGIDQCPNTPQGAKVDAKGCPIDSDGDGVPDGIDQCPDTPKGETVDAKGCPMDSDGDGVPDGIDQCPDTPKGAIVDAKGCPLDSDLDGVPDGIDKCPNTPPGTKVDATGCPLPVEAVSPTPPSPTPPTAPGKCPPAPPGSKVDANGCLILFAPEAARSPTPGAPPRPTLILTGVNFETGRSVLTRDSYLVLDAVAASLLANPDIRIEVAGYTDSTGRKYINYRLSQARAAAVRFYLARKGVPPARMIAKGYGASGYIAPNSTAAGRAQNRRVELHKLP